VVDAGINAVPQPVPPPTSGGDATSDHPDHYIPEAVRNFLPFFYQKFKDKVPLETGRC